MEDVVPQLEQSLVSDPALEVQETCGLALRRIKEQNNKNNGDATSLIEASAFLSVDPAIPASCCSSVDQPS